MYTKFLKNKIYSLNNNFACLKVEGPDSFDFLNRQLTNDLKDLHLSQFQMNARLERNGRLQSFFYLLRESENIFYILVQPEMKSLIFNELNKFLITEDVNIEEYENNFMIYLGLGLLNKDLQGMKGKVYNLPAVISKEEISCEKMDEITENIFRILTAWPVLGKTVSLDVLVNETMVNELAVSYKKGCFLGQETAAKIHTRRGAAKYPTWLISKAKITDDLNFRIYDSLKIEDDYITLADLPRELRVQDKKLELNNHEVKVKMFSPLDLDNYTQLAKNIYHEAISVFHKKNDEEALDKIDLAILLDPKNPDLYEVKGAILGQMNLFEKAISVMDELLGVDENSVMAHTNKSLFLMKIGKIPEAEEEKALATVASFAQFGAIAKQKKEIEEKVQKEKAELERKKTMFRQVLAIDEMDEIANFGLADISFKNDEYETSLTFLEKVLSSKPKYSQALLLKGKVLEKLGRIEEAKTIYSQGIEVASKQGEMMPANEMQSRLNSLN